MNKKFVHFALHMCVYVDGIWSFESILFPINRITLMNYISFLKLNRLHYR